VRPSASRALVALTLLAALVAQARADESSGTWTGNVELRGNYYWERSTRIVAPSLDVNLYSPSGLTIHGDYLIDTITSASQASGALVDERFHEIRHDVGLGLQYEFDRNERQVVVGAYGRHSTEPDYTSLNGGMRVELYLDQRSTVFRFALNGLHDEIRQVFRTGTGALPGMGGTTSADAFKESMHAVSSRASWTQLLSPNTEVQVALDWAYVEGFQANAYRTVSVNGVSTPEHYPDQRYRYTLSGHLAYYIDPTHSAIRLQYRAYYDTWRIGSLTPEIWFFQEMGDFALARFRYRYYVQTPAFFYESDPTNYPRPDGYVTGDAKMAGFHTHTFGLQLQLFTKFFASTSLDWLRGAHLDISFDYVWSTSGYGNAVISQAGFRVPF